MTKKKRGHPDLEEVLARPWCYYCERDFDDLKILINHQKAKHFKCERCGRRLNTAGGLNVHMSQVHKEALSAVDNALPNRAGLDIEIFGMEGIPEDIIQQHTQRVIANYHQNLTENQVSSGTGGTLASGTGGAVQAKKPKFESPSELKKRLAEHKARLAEQQSGGNSGGGTPLGAGQTQSPPGTYQNSPPYSQQPSYPPSNGSSPYPSQTPGFGAAAPYPQQQQTPQPPYSAPGAPPAYGYSQPPPQPGAYTANPYPQPSFSPPPASYPGQPQMQTYPPGSYPPPMVSAAPLPYQNGPPGGPPVPYSTASPLTYQPEHGALPTRPGSLPPAPGLPQRPTFGAPHVNAFQMQQMHQGQIPGPQNPVLPQPVGNEPSSLDELISGASRQAEEAAKAQTAPPTASVPAIPVDPSTATAVATQPETLQTLPPPADPSADPKKPAEEQGEEKTTKKDKEKSKASRLVYSDNEVSPEEKMAHLPRYSFTMQKVGA